MWSWSTQLEEKKPYNSFHFSKYIILNICTDVFYKDLKVLGDKTSKNLLCVVAIAKRCILWSARDVVVCACGLPYARPCQRKSVRLPSFLQKAVISSISDIMAVLLSGMLLSKNTLTSSPRIFPEDFPIGNYVMIFIFLHWLLTHYLILCHHRSGWVKSTQTPSVGQ
jgi:hypothetical protein